MIDHCTHLRDLLDEEMKRVMDHPDFKAFKWYRSEEEHHDIGEREALKGFSETEYWEKFCEQFREGYCGTICADRHECVIGAKYAKHAEEKGISGETFLSKTP